MNRLTISARAFHQPETLGNAIAALTNWIDQQKIPDVTIAGDPGEIRITMKVPVDSGLLLYVSDYMQGHGDYTTEVDVIGAGSVGLDLR